MRKFEIAAAATAILVLAAPPAASQMVGTVGANPGESPSEARQTDQTFDELRNKGTLDNTGKAADELAAGANLVKEHKFAEAVPHLEAALARRPRDVTALTYLGFAHRMIGSNLSGDAAKAEYEKALEYYRRGLAIDSRNRLLHEYAGKVHLLLHDAPSAEAEQAALKRLCPDGCDELSTLSEVLNLFHANEALRQPAK
jgi:tetratricopeptide (TPR) repeat protein